MPAKKTVAKKAAKKTVATVATVASKNEQAEARGPGRPAFQVTPDMRSAVKQLSAFGIPQENICQMISPDKANPIDVKTLAKHFPYEIKNGRQEAIAKMGGKLFQTGMEGNVGAMQFYLRTQGGWREAPTEIELAGKGGGPIVSAEIARTVVSLSDYKDAVAELLKEF